MSQHIEFISAGAGSGKTYSITNRLREELESQSVQPAGVIATTFTRRAATELQERVREALMEAGLITLANQMSQSMISTVNGVCGLLLQRFSFEAGYSPELNVIDDKQEKRLFNEAVDEVLGEDLDKIQRLNGLSYRLGIEDNGQPLWRKQLADIVSAARANNCQPDALPGFAKQSSDELIAHFREPITRDLDALLFTAAEQALTEIDVTVDTTGATKTYVDLLRRVISFGSAKNLPWPDWIALSKKGPGAKSRLAAEPVQSVAGDYEVHSRLTADIREYTAELFDIAAQCLNAYQAIKQHQGLIDFVDQELLVYQLLENPTVKETLKEELQLLMVDEFQDTSPIQLALFSRLAALADKVIWVGDIKQAIYGFRGSDPELMHAVVDQLTKDGGKLAVLEKSWRSRPALVNYCNEIFANAFENSLSRDKIVLQPAREEVLPENAAVAHWELSGKKSEQLDMLASMIRTLVEDGFQIVDKKTEIPRSCRYGDIAVLCRQNSRLTELAHAFAAVGVAVSYSRPGLLKAPESVLALSCLRRVFDEKDTLASAQIRGLVHAESVDAWLSERLRYLQSDQPSGSWGEQGEGALPELVALAAMRPRLDALTPVEALNESLAVAGVREAVVRWGPSAQRARVRLANIDCLISYAQEYESSCQLKHVAATVPGLLQWLSELEKDKEDLQAVTVDDDTVQLLTYHGSKGLEWPVVICHDLEFEPRSRLWGLKALSVVDKIDIADPLKGRCLRFFPSFFGSNKNGVPVKDRVEASPTGQAESLSALEEEKRVQYVAFTRARDLLVLASKGQASSVKSTLNTPWLFPDGGTLVMPNGTAIPTQTVEGFARIFPEHKGYQPQYIALEKFQGRVLPRSISPSSVVGVEGAGIKSVVELGERFELKKSVEMADLGNAFHGIFAADINFAGGLDVAQAEAILRRFGVESAVSVEDVLQSGRKLTEHLGKAHHVTKLYPEFPIQWVNGDGQSVSGFIDLLVETADGFLIIDHKSAPGGRSKWPEMVSKYSGQLQCYREAIQQLSARPVLGCYLHLIVAGALLEVAYE